MGDTLQMKYIEGGENVLYPRESIAIDLMAIGIFIAVGLFSIILGFKRQ
jgi:hypothetical protein